MKKLIFLVILILPFAYPHTNAVASYAETTYFKTPLAVGALGKTGAIFHMNGNANDSYVNANTGVSTAITYGVPFGRFGQGGSFNGTTSQASTTLVGFPAATSSRTIIGWMYQTSAATVNSLIAYGANTGAQDTFQVYVNANVLNVDTNGSGVAFTGGTSFALNQWYMIAVSWGGGTGTTVQGYQNGTRLADGTITAPNTGTVFSFIGRNQQNTFHMTGYIDEILVDSRQWTDQEIRNYYNQTRGFYGPQTN